MTPDQTAQQILDLLLEYPELVETHSWDHIRRLAKRYAARGDN